MLHRYTVLDIGTIIAYLANMAILLTASYLFYLCFEKHTPQVRDFLYRNLLPASLSNKAVPQ